jgi:hypothetical protein
MRGRNSALSRHSRLSFGSVGSLASFFSILSIGSAGSILCIGARGGLLRIGTGRARPGAPAEAPAPSAAL